MTSVTGWDTQPAAKAPPEGPAETAPRVTGSGSDGQVQPAAASRRAARQDPVDTTPTEPQPAKKDEQKEKKGLLRRILGVFK